MVKVPPVAPLLARGDGYFDGAPEEWQVLLEGLGAHWVLDEKRRQALDELAAAYGFGKVEPLVEVDAEIAVLTHALTRFLAVLQDLVQALAGVKRAAGAQVGGAHAKRAVAGFNGGVRAFADAHARLDGGNDAGGVVALAIIAHHAA